MSSLLILAFATLFGCLVSNVNGATASASACSTSLTPTNSIQPTVASGYQMALIATGLTKPRSMQFDSAGNLLVVQQGTGIVNLVLQDEGRTCLSVKSSKNVIENKSLNHGIALSADGKTLYASSAEAAYSWPYDPATVSVGGKSTTLVSGMSTEDHTTRTLLIPQKANDRLLISRGSTANVDTMAEDLGSGHSQIKAFDLGNVPSDGYRYNTDGLRLGWGLRNSVGLAEHPLTGGIYSVENSVDQIMREGKDIHEDNPGEEMNFHGYLNGTAYAPQGSNYGYPYCFSAWVPSNIPENKDISVGTQFAMGDQNSTINDTFCSGTTPPRLTFQAHQAPLDIKFNNSGAEGWVTFHGSWDRTNPVGYKVSVIPFENGEPVAAASNNTATTDIFTNLDNSKCPSNCFRPAGLAFDQQGRLYISSDASGEIYVVVRDQTANSTGTGTGAGTGSGTSTGSAPTASMTTSAVARTFERHRVATLLVALGLFGTVTSCILS